MEGLEAMRIKNIFATGRRARTLFVIFNTAFMLLLAVIMLGPILKIFVDSVDPTSVYGMRIIPRAFSLDAYKYIIGNESLYRPFLVSVVTTLLGTFSGLSVTTMAAYVLIQKKMPGHKLFVYMILLTMLFNGGLIPTYLTIKGLGLLSTVPGSILAVIIPLGLSAYNITLMKGFFEGIPGSLFEAAEIDGYSPMGIFLRIVLPLSKPALASVGLFIAVAMWNDFFHFTIYVTESRWYNFQVKVRELILNDALASNTTAATGGISAEMLKSATIIVVMAPFLIVYPFLQKYFVKGVTLGAVKG